MIEDARDGPEVGYGECIGSGGPTSGRQRRLMISRAVDIALISNTDQSMREKQEKMVGVSEVSKSGFGRA